MSDRITAGGHVRVRPFNTADTYPEQKLGNDLCQAVVAGNTVYLRGQVAQDLDTRESVAIGDPAGQAEKVMDNIELLLGECGSELGHITTCHVYVTDIRYREPVYQVLGRRMQGVFPVFTGLVVPALARPEWVVEVTATAVIPMTLLRWSGAAPRTGMFGAAVSSSSPAVAARCAFARSSVGRRLLAERHRPAARPAVCSTCSPAASMPTRRWPRWSPRRRMSCTAS